MNYLSVCVGIILLIILIAAVNAVLNIAKDTKTIKNILIDWEKERNKKD